MHNSDLKPARDMTHDPEQGLFAGIRIRNFPASDTAPDSQNAFLFQKGRPRIRAILNGAHF
jgi:hypothetical protein